MHADPSSLLGPVSPERKVITRRSNYRGTLPDSRSRQVFTRYVWTSAEQSFETAHSIDPLLMSYSFRRDIILMRRVGVLIDFI